MDQWLIRTAQNKITGPYTREEVCKQIQDGKLDLQDEVCQANGYWIYLHEREEVLKQLGIEIPHIRDEDEEITETQTETAVTSKDEAPIPDLPPIAEDHAQAVERMATKVEKVLRPQSVYPAPADDVPGLRKKRVALVLLLAVAIICFIVISKMSK